MSRFVMIDLETLGTAPGCSIVSIGAVCADRDGFIRNRFYTVVSRASCKDYGLHESQRTLDWWADQSEQAREVLAQSEMADAASLPDALACLNAFVQARGDVDVYGNGSDFDNSILAAAAHLANVELAWPFWRNRCYRTIKALHPEIRLDRKGTHHNALDDAETQAVHLGRINRAMGLTADIVDRAHEFIGWIADRFQRCTRLRFLGIPINTMRREVAIGMARDAFDAAQMDAPFGDPELDWTRAGADDLADEEMRLWEGE